MKKIITNHYRCSCGRSVDVESPPMPVGMELSDEEKAARGDFFARTQRAVEEAHAHQKTCAGTPSNTMTMKDCPDV